MYLELLSSIFELPFDENLTDDKKGAETKKNKQSAEVEEEDGYFKWSSRNLNDVGCG